jgi:hypothetical protein
MSNNTLVKAVDKNFSYKGFYYKTIEKNIIPLYSTTTDMMNNNANFIETSINTSSYSTT